MEPGQTSKDSWGVTWDFKEGQIGPFPVHDDEHKVIKDIAVWRKYVKKPVVPTSDEMWAPAVAHANGVDRNEEFVTAFVGPGVFEMTHHLMSMEDALIAYYVDPEAMHELIDFLTEYELEFAKIMIDRIS